MGVTAGFALPPLAAHGLPGSFDILTRVTFPVPYGFAGPSLGNLVKVGRK